MLGYPIVRLQCPAGFSGLALVPRKRDAGQYVDICYPVRATCHGFSLSLSFPSPSQHHVPFGLLPVVRSRLAHVALRQPAQRRHGRIPARPDAPGMGAAILTAKTGMGRSTESRPDDL